MSTDDEKFIGTTADGKQIRLASQKELTDYRAEVDDIIAILGYGRVLVTDLSSVSDFFLDAEQDQSLRRR